MNNCDICLTYIKKRFSKATMKIEFLPKEYIHLCEKCFNEWIHDSPELVKHFLKIEEQNEKNIVKMNITGNYKWTVRKFNVTGLESTTGYLSSREEAIEFILKDGNSAFLLLVNPEDERDKKTLNTLKWLKIRKVSLSLKRLIIRKR
ncbi:hypothetical protein M3Y14_32440 (plasmid) [Bacillus thuringiensis]|uniref:hypothetical protein n=1 Tax=Bacillus thuringiensis TaxID=1428 RepID=UPI0022245A90|nr:hypothetical protein [Bacillus thuringiensis]UYX55941.1 hypothetical protein M3Y14_32440 [Bacillus thuringiensis]